MRRSVLLIAFIAVLPVQATAAPGERGVKVFFLVGEQLAPVVRAVADTPHPERAALGELLAGPTAKERSVAYRTAFPRGTRLLRLRLEGDRAAVSLRLPPTAATRFQASIAPARAAQVTFTLQALGYEHISLSVNGHSVATPSGVQPLLAPPDPPELRPRAPAPADVLGVQSQLHAIRYLPREAVRGVWDYRTEQAVIALQSWAGLERDGVVGPRTLAALSVSTIPFPSSSAEARRVEVYRDRGVALLVSRGVVLRAIHVSSGPPGFSTPGGSFRVYRKERLSWSVPYKVWLPLASYFYRGVAFHAYPEIPTRPASHGCVRVPYPEAGTVYFFATLGSTVKIF